MSLKRYHEPTLVRREPIDLIVAAICVSDCKH